MKPLISARTLTAIVVSAAAALSVAACGDDDDTSGSSGSATTPASDKLIVSNPANASKPRLTIGSKNFTEQLVVGEIYSQALQAAGYKVKKELNLGSEQIAFKAVKSGQVDAYPEYTGTALANFFGVKAADIPKDEQAAYEQARDGFAKSDLTALAPTPFTSSNEVGMTQAKATELGVEKISDLADKAKDLTLSGSPECRQRTDCKLGLEQVYGLKFKKFLPVDLALRHDVLTKGQADVGIVFTTDGQIAAQKLTLLEDDKNMFPPYNVTLVVRDRALADAGPDLKKTIEAVEQGMTAETMQELNSRVDLDKQKVADVAAAYLKESGYTN